MIFSKIYGLLPEKFRKRGITVALSIFLRAILDFAGVAVLIPVLAGLLEEGRDPWSVLPVAAGALAFIILKGIAVTLLTNFRSNFVYSLYSELSGSLLRAFLGRGLLFIKQSDSVSLANKVNSVTMVFVSGVILSLLNALSSIILLIIILCFLFIYDPISTALIIIVIGPLMVGYSYLLRSRMRRLGMEENKARRAQARAVLDFFRGYTDYVVNDAVESQMQKFEAAVQDVRGVKLKTERWSTVASGFMEVTVILSIIIIMMLSFTSSYEISMTFGIFALSALKVLPSVRSLVGCWQSFQSSSYSVDVLGEILSEEIARPGDGEISFNDALELRNVSFQYPDSGKYIFRNFHLTLAKGDYVGIKGASGVGKTTLFNILMGFFFPQEGGLYIDGTKLTAENVKAWQAMIGYVPQDIFLVGGSFVDNIALGRRSEDVDREKIKDILIRVGLWDWVSSLPSGMDSPIAEAGNTVSGGQKQRIGIARALYKGASVLFFDEATSSVDVAAEVEINEFIAELSGADGDLTVIVIAHRQETLNSCRRVVELEMDAEDGGILKF